MYTLPSREISTPLRGHTLHVGSTLRKLLVDIRQQSFRGHLRRRIPEGAMHPHQVNAQILFGGEPDTAHAADGVAAVPGQVLAAPRPVSQNLAAARHGAGKSTTCRSNETD